MIYFAAGCCALPHLYRHGRFSNNRYSADLAALSCMVLEDLQPCLFLFIYLFQTTKAGAPLRNLATTDRLIWRQASENFHLQFHLLRNLRTGASAHASSYSVGTAVLSWPSSSLVVILTTQLHLRPRLRTSKSISDVPPYTFMTCKGTTLALTSLQSDKKACLWILSGSLM